MDYVEMIKDPELVLGFLELISDSDAVVVKRTVRVFTSVYHHTLRLLACGELEEETLRNCWSSVKSVVDRLLSMVKGCDNEGILIHLLRFLEAAVISHLLYDFSPFPFVFERGREVVKTGLKSLKDLVTTPYVGGSSFIVGIRALISIACLRPDLWEPVTDLLKKQLTSLPPTLFDHNVRSLNKTLQRNLFRLLRRAETPELKEKLVEMMVSVGVPRKVTMPWAPRPTEPKKRELTKTLFNLEGRPLTPPEKKLRVEEEKESNAKAGPSDRLCDPRLTGPQDPRKVCQPDNKSPNRSPVPQSNSPVPPTNLLVPQNRSPVPPSNSPVPHSNSLDPQNDSLDPQNDSPDPQNRSPVPQNRSPVPKAANADLMFLTSLIPTGSTKPTEPPEEVATSPFEDELFAKLDLDLVARLVIRNINALPDKEPLEFSANFKNQSVITDTVHPMRKKVASMMANYLTDHKVQNFSNSSFNKDSLRTCLPTKRDENSNTKPLDTTGLDSASSASSTPSSSPPLSDTDMRRAYSHPSTVGAIKDIDMRVTDPRLATRDPRMPKDPRLKKDVADPRLESRGIPRSDPRLQGKTTVEPNSRVDPRLANAQNKRLPSEPRKTRWDPRTPPQNNSVPPLPPTNSLPQVLPGMRSEATSSSKQCDPRTNRPLPQGGMGLLPHPDPRMQIQNCDLQMPQRLGGQSQFPFTQMNPPNQFNNSLVSGLPARNSMPPIMNGSSFSWQNNLRKPPPSMLMPPNMNTVQQGMMPPTVLNL